MPGKLLFSVSNLSNRRQKTVDEEPITLGHDGAKVNSDWCLIDPDKAKNCTTHHAVNLNKELSSKSSNREKFSSMCFDTFQKP